MGLTDLKIEQLRHYIDFSNMQGMHSGTEGSEVEGAAAGYVLVCES